LRCAFAVESTPIARAPGTALQERMPALTRRRYPERIDFNPRFACKFGPLKPESISTSPVYFLAEASTPESAQFGLLCRRFRTRRRLEFLPGKLLV